MNDIERAEVAVVGWRRAHRVMVEAAEEVERSGRVTTTFDAEVPLGPVPPAPPPSG